MRTRAAALIATPIVLTTGAVIVLAHYESEQPAPAPAAQTSMSTPSPTAPRSTYTPPPTSTDDFDLLVRSQGLTSYGTVSELRDTGEIMCDALDSGTSLDAVLLIGLNEGFPADDLGTYAAITVMSSAPATPTSSPTDPRGHPMPTFLTAIAVTAGAYVAASLGIFITLIRLLSRQTHYEEN